MTLESFITHLRELASNLSEGAHPESQAKARTCRFIAGQLETLVLPEYRRMVVEVAPIVQKPGLGGVPIL